MKIKCLAMLTLLLFAIGCSAIRSSTKPDELEKYFSEKICTDDQVFNWLEKFF